jgi:hypothetical protein
VEEERDKQTRRRSMIVYIQIKLRIRVYLMVCRGFAVYHGNGIFLPGHRVTAVIIEPRKSFFSHSEFCMNKTTL